MAKGICTRWPCLNVPTPGEEFCSEHKQHAARVAACCSPITICRVTKRGTPDPKSILVSDFCMVMVPMKAAEISELPWEAVQELLLRRTKEIGLEMHAPSMSEAIIFGGEVSRKLAAQGRMLLVEGLALLSFVEGGVTFAGFRYASDHPEAPYRQPNYEDTP